MQSPQIVFGRDAFSRLQPPRWKRLLRSFVTVAVVLGVVGLAVRTAHEAGLLYVLAAAIVDYMDAAPALPLGLLYLLVAGIPATLVHELGHACAARRRLGGGVEVSLGTAGKLAELRLRQIHAINAFSHRGGVSGARTFDASRALAADVIAIALAGPGASFAAAMFTATALRSVGDTGLPHDLLWAALMAHVSGVLTLIPLTFQERRGGPAVRTDGRVLLDALRVALVSR